MKKYLVLFWVIFLTLNAKTQENHQFSVKLSPFGFFGNRFNTSIERLTGKHVTYGMRVEASLVDAGLDKHLWINPYWRGYVVSNESSGLYLEAGMFYRLRYAKSPDWRATQDWYKSAAGFRIAPGFQFHAGKNKSIPIDILAGFNVDLGNGNVTDDTYYGAISGPVNVALGPLSVFLFRIQTGISF